VEGFFAERLELGGDLLGLVAKLSEKLLFRLADSLVRVEHLEKIELLVLPDAAVGENYFLESGKEKLVELGWDLACVAQQLDEEPHVVDVEITLVAKVIANDVDLLIGDVSVSQ
jgi:hypothetical protein